MNAQHRKKKVEVHTIKPKTRCNCDAQIVKLFAQPVQTSAHVKNISHFVAHEASCF